MAYAIAHNKLSQPYFVVKTKAEANRKMAKLKANGIKGRLFIYKLAPGDYYERYLRNPESRFKKLEEKLAKSHGGSASSYGGLAAYIGRKKYGAKKFAAMSRVGRRKKRESNPSSTIPVRGIKISKDGEIQILANPSAKRKLSNLAKRLGGKLT